MFHKFTVLSLSILFSISLQAQDSISYEKTFGGYRFEQDGNFLRPSQMVQIMESHQDAAVYMKKAKGNADMANVLAFAGGFMVGWPVGTAIGGGDPNWGLAAVGGGLLLATIPLVNGFNKNAIAAVELYNGSLRNPTSLRPCTIKFCVNPNGVGLKMVF